MSTSHEQNNYRHLEKESALTIPASKKRKQAGSHHTVLQSKKAVSAYVWGTYLLHFGFAPRHHRTMVGAIYVGVIFGCCCLREDLPCFPGPPPLRPGSPCYPGSRWSRPLRFQTRVIWAWPSPGQGTRLRDISSAAWWTCSYQNWLPLRDTKYKRRHMT